MIYIGSVVSGDRITKDGKDTNETIHRKVVAEIKYEEITYVRLEGESEFLSTRRLHEYTPKVTAADRSEIRNVVNTLLCALDFPFFEARQMHGGPYTAPPEWVIARKYLIDVLAMQANRLREARPNNKKEMEEVSKGVTNE